MDRDHSKLFTEEIEEVGLTSAKRRRRRGVTLLSNQNSG